jgi:two-component system cell cycle sensor histidine kinase/response regulator CckA
LKYSSKSSRPRLFGWLQAGKAHPELTDQPDTTLGALTTTLRQDPVALASFVLLLGLQVTAWVLPDGEGTLGRYLPLLYLVLVAILARVGLQRIIQKEERRLWHGIALAFGLRFLAEVLALTLGIGNRWVELASDGVYALAFLVFVVAVERPVPRRTGIHSTDLGRLLTWPGGSVFAIGLFVYMSLIPAVLDSAYYITGLPSFYMLVIFELYVAVKLVLFAYTTEWLRWRMLYSLLFLAMAMLLAKDFAAGLVFADVLPPVWGVVVQVLCTLAFLVLVIAVRLRHHPFPTEESLFDSVNRKDPLPWPHGNVMVFALVFPLIHFGFSAARLLDARGSHIAAAQDVREAVVLLWLLLFGAMALLQQRFLEKRARSLWTERMRAEEALHKSNETLRLVNERSEAEEALRKSEEKFLKAFRSIPDSMVISTLAEGRIREVNESFESYFGYRREEVLGKTGVELDMWVELEDRAMMTRILRERGAVRNFEFGFYSKKGEKRLSLLSGEILELDGEMCLLMVLRDITERKKAEDKIREQAELLDKAQDAISVRDLAGTILYWNKSAERVYGFTAAEVSGRNVDHLLQPRDGEQLAAIQEEVKDRGEWAGELEQTRRDGSEVIIESRWTLVRNAAGKGVSMLVINTEVTEKRRLKNRLRRSERLQAIGVVTSGIAHDLSNILTPILVTTETLRRQNLDKKFEPLIASLSANARRGADIVRHVLTFAGQADGERVSFQSRFLVNDMERWVRKRFPETIALKVGISEEPWSVQGDAGPMYQVLLSLCTNACEAMEEAGGTLRLEITNVWMDKFYARRHDQAHEGPYVVLTVSDTGVGIPTEDLEKIWDPFFSTKEVEGGGLGLAMSQAIVRAHGGFMTVYSESEGIDSRDPEGDVPDGGTSFQVYLPAAAQEEGPDEAAPELPAGRGERVLVVDDDGAIRDIIEQTLEAFNYEVRVASGGVEALEIYRQHQAEIDIVLLDMMMPVMDGFTTARELIELNADVRVIAVSGLVTKDRVMEIENVRTFLEKPYTAEKLLRTLRDVLAEGQEGDEGQARAPGQQEITG